MTSEEPRETRTEQPSEVRAEEQRATRAEQRGTWALTPGRHARRSELLTFAGSLILLVGLFNLVAGLTALFRPTYFLAGPNSLLVFDFTAWGGIWLGVGVLQIVVGLGVLMEQIWSRVAGVVLAGLSAIGHLAFVAAFPIWSVLVIALSVLVIYALVTATTRVTT
jgi:hypothetical protein